MALNNYVFDLSGVSADGSVGDISVKSGVQTLATASAAGISITPVVIDGFGTFTFNNGKVTFKADAALPVGSYTVTTAGDSNHVSLEAFNASKASKGITLVANGAAEFVGTTGDDTVSVTADSASVRGGFGADTFVFGSDVASTVEDYKYSEGDVVSLGFDASAIALASDGTFTADTASVKADESNSEGLFYVDLNKNGSKVLMATASGHKSEVSVTLSDKAGLVDVSAADTAVVDLGTGSDTVKGADSTALTLKVGRADGNNSIATSLDANDTLQIISGDMGDIKATGGNVTIAATTLTSALNSNDATYSVNVQFGSEAAKKLVYNLGDTDVDYAADAGYYLGNGNGKLVVNANTASVDVDMAKSTSGIKGVDLTSAAAGKDVNIVAKGDTSINANTAAHADATWTFDLTAKDSSTGKDELVLTNATGKDVVKLSTTGGVDEITGFNATEDVIELTGVSELAKDTFSVDTDTKLVLKDGATITLASDVKTGDVTIVLGDKTEKVAFADKASKKAVVTKDTTKVINTSSGAGSVDFVVDADAENGVGVIDLANSGVGKAQFIGEFGNVSVDTSAAAALVIGNENDNTITVTGDKSAAVWAGAKSDNNINLTAATAQDIVWTGSLDGKNTVTGFGNNDVVYVYDANLTAQDVVSKLSVDKVTNDVVFATSDTASLTLTNGATVGTINVMGADENGYKVAVGTTTVAFDKDASIFLTRKDGSLTVDNAAVTEGTVTAIDLSGTLEGNDKLYVGVKDIDASRSAGSFLLIGNNANGATLKGGQTGNAIWGGGNASQTMTGVAGVTDIFWFGTQDGHDTAAAFETAKDVVFLYNATNINEIELGFGANTNVIFSATGSTLTLGGVTENTVGNVTFMLNDGAGTYKYYNYDADSKSFVEKK